MKKLPNEIENSIKSMADFIALEKLWGKIKEYSLPTANSQYAIGSKVAIPGLQKTELIVADVCSYDNINMYLLKYEQNGAYKLITSEDCIVLS